MFKITHGNNLKGGFSFGVVICIIFEVMYFIYNFTQLTFFGYVLILMTLLFEFTFKT